VATRLEEFATAVHAALGDPSVKAYFDATALQEHKQRRRIVWVTPGGTTETPRQSGGMPPSDGSKMRIQACRVRVENIDAHIYAENRETTEILLDNLIAAVCLTINPAEMPTYTWETETLDNAGRTLRIAHCILRIYLRLPVPDEIKQLFPIRGVEDECGTLQDDGSIKPQG
jgi:hypothetical protein